MDRTRSRGRIRECKSCCIHLSEIKRNTLGGFWNICKDFRIYKKRNPRNWSLAFETCCSLPASWAFLALCTSVMIWSGVASVKTCGTSSPNVGKNVKVSMRSNFSSSERLLVCILAAARLLVTPSCTDTCTCLVSSLCLRYLCAASVNWWDCSEMYRIPNKFESYSMCKPGPQRGRQH